MGMWKMEDVVVRQENCHTRNGEGLSYVIYETTPLKRQNKKLNSVVISWELIDKLVYMTRLVYMTT